MEKRIKKRFLALALSITLMWSSVSNLVFATAEGLGEENAFEDVVEDGSGEEKGSEVVDENATSGKCGENLTWFLADDGTLTVSGTGEMVLETSEDGEVKVPWENIKSKIVKVLIEEGLRLYTIQYLKNAQI